MPNQLCNIGFTCTKRRSDFRERCVIQNQIYICKLDFKDKNEHVIQRTTIGRQPILHGKSNMQIRFYMLVRPCNIGNNFFEWTTEDSGRKKEFNGIKTFKLRFYRKEKACTQIRFYMVACHVELILRQNLAELILASK